MARLNIEDKIWFDPRFTFLKKKHGEFEAMGMLVCFWRLAQEAWQKGQLISEKQFKMAGFSKILIEAGFAEVYQGLVYAAGSKEQFAWIVSKAKNGQKGGQISGIKRSNENKHLIEANRSESKLRPSESKPPTPTPTPTPTLSLNTNTKKLQRTKGEVATPPADMPFVISTYVESFQTRYGLNTRPELTGKSLGILKRLVGQLPRGRLANLLQVYLQMDDKWFQTKCHDLATFEQNLQKVSLALDTGQKDPGNKSEMSVTDILKERDAHGLNTI